MLHTLPINQCTMCTTFNEVNRKSCIKCRCRKYLQPCSSAEWQPSRHDKYRFNFYKGTPRNPYPGIELEYYNNAYVVGWVIFKNENFTQYVNKDLGKNDVHAAQNWALRIIDEHLL